MVPEQLQLSEPNSIFSFEELGFERLCMESTASVCTTPSNAADATLCDVTFITELMESAMPTYAMSSDTGDVALCDVTFITELMECDFAHTNQHQYRNDTVDADHAVSSDVQIESDVNEEQLNHVYGAALNVDPDDDNALSTHDQNEIHLHSCSHHHAEQFQGSHDNENDTLHPDGAVSTYGWNRSNLHAHTHQFDQDSALCTHAQNASNPDPHSQQHAEQFLGFHDNDNVDLSPDGAMSNDVQNASNLQELLAESLVNVYDGSSMDHINTGVEGGVATHIQEACSVHAHAQHCGQQSHGFQDSDVDHVDLHLIGSRNQSTHTLHDCVDVTEFQAHSDPHSRIGLTPCSSDGSELEDSLLRFPHHVDVTKEALLAALAEEGSIDHCSDKEKLEHHEDLREKSHMANLNLLHLLLACAEAVSEDDLELASVVLARLQELSCKYGSPLQRLSFYLCNALEARIVSSAQDEFRRSLRMPLPPCDMLEAFCVFYNVNPIGRFCHLTLNQLILDNTISDIHVHIVDLHIGYGMQWAAFLQAITLRQHGPPKLRLTAIGPREEHLVSTGKKLMDLARTLQISFEYCPIASHLQSFEVGMIDIRQDEVCVISSLGQFHTLLHKGSEFVDAFLAGLRSLEPKVLVLAENDVNHNDPLFLNRFVECLKYYGAVFESLDAALPPTSQARLKIEKLLCGRKIGSIVACEGAERVERHENMHDWMRRLERAGFRNASLTHTAINQAKLLLNLYYPNGYSLIEDHDALTLQWNGAALMAIGVWQ